MKIKYNPSQDKRVQEFNTLIERKFPQFLTETDPEVILVAGGDGAMLHAITDNINQDVIFFGKSLGTLNFLMNDIEDDEKTLNSLANNGGVLDIFKANAIKVELNGKKIGEAVNDVIIGNGLMSYYNFEITSENGDFQGFEVKGGGICISTPIGSTAFNFNNNGRIIPLESCLLSITGIVCNKYINDIVQFQKIDIKSSGGRVYLSGIEKAELTSSDVLTLSKGSEVKIGFLDKSVFLERRVNLAHRFRR